MVKPTWQTRPATTSGVISVMSLRSAFPFLFEAAYVLEEGVPYGHSWAAEGLTRIHIHAYGHLVSDCKCTIGNAVSPEQMSLPEIIQPTPCARHTSPHHTGTRATGLLQF